MNVILSRWSYVSGASTKRTVLQASWLMMTTGGGVGGDGRGVGDGVGVDVVATHASQKTGQMAAMFGMSHCAPLIWLQKGTSSATPLHLPSTIVCRVVVARGAAVLCVGRGVGGGGVGRGVAGGSGVGGGGVGAGVGVGGGFAANWPPTQQRTVRGPEQPLRW